MDWFKIETSVLSNEAFGCAETIDIGIWVRLMHYCCLQENSGRIREAKSWDERKWMHLCRLTKAEIARKSELWTWRGNDLYVHEFPTTALNSVKRLRRESSRAAKARWGGQKEKRAPQSVASHRTDASAMPQGINTASHEASIGDANRHRKRMPVGYADKSRVDKSRVEKRRERVRAMPDGIAAPTRDQVIAFFAEHAGSEPQAVRFFLHFTAAGWLQPNGQPLVDWRARAELWLSDDRKAVSENSSDGAGGPPPGFDPLQPNAHTGGVEVAN